MCILGNKFTRVRFLHDLGSIEFGGKIELADFPASAGERRTISGFLRRRARRDWASLGWQALIGGVAPSVTGLWPTALALRSCARITIPVSPSHLLCPPFLPVSLYACSIPPPRFVPRRDERLSGFLLPPEMQETRFIRASRRIKRGLKIIWERCITLFF